MGKNTKYSGILEKKKKKVMIISVLSEKEKKKFNSLISLKERSALGH